jgi:phage host-nuclease inhibitor protein Gam
MIFKDGYELQMRLESWAEEHDGDISEFPLDEGIETICQSIINYDSQVECIQAQIKKLQDRVKSCEKNSDWLSGSLKNLIVEGEKYTYPTTTITWRRSNPVEVLNEQEIPEIYFRIEKTVDKDKITKAINSGEVVAGAILKQKFNMKVK